MDITKYVMVAWFIGFVVGLVAMYVIIEISFRREHKRRNKSMLDFAEYAEKRREKKIDFDMFENVGGSFDEKRAD